MPSSRNARPRGAMPESVQPSVQFREAAGAAHKVGFAHLSAEKSLNALSLDMVRLLDAQLREWARDDAVACVVLDGEGAKAFCAGGDLRALYRSMREHPGALPNPQALAFFSEEYRLDYRIHRYPKPLLVWGSGIVMGGGLGLLAGASHRVVTENSRIAMPEISIGLFPDVGASYFLPRMPGRTGLFVALTAVPLNARDALHGKLADHLLPGDSRSAVFERLTQLPWRGDSAADRTLLTQLLQDFPLASAALPASNLERHAAAIEALCAGDSLPEVVRRIVAYGGEDAWLKRGAAALAAASPTAATLIGELARRALGLSLAEVFRLELIVALQCCAHPDLTEGVRALLIDKDNHPRWTPPTLAAVTPAWTAEHFTEPDWPRGTSPLADL